jgi:hypothetical protein
MVINKGIKYPPNIDDDDDYLPDDLKGHQSIPSRTWLVVRVQPFFMAVVTLLHIRTGFHHLVMASWSV